MKADRASSTSLLIARYILLADATPALRPLVLNDSAALTRRLLSVAGPARWLDVALKSRFLRRVLLATEIILLPGIGLHWLARKRLIDALASESITGGCSQLVVLGAGLDTLALRLCSSCSCVELDHPATQEGKRRAITDRPALVAADLTRDSIGDALRAQPGFSPAQRTLFIAEGLLMYLPPERVAAIFDELAALSPPGSRFTFTFMEARPGRPIAFHNSRRVIDWWLRLRGEPFRWALARPEVEGFVAQHGWKLASLSSPEELRRRFLAPHGLDNAPLAIGESVAMTHRLAS